MKLKLWEGKSDKSLKLISRILRTTMSKFVASESNEGQESRKTGVKRRKGNEENEKENVILNVPSAESLTISTTVSTAAPTWITMLR